MLAHGAQPWVPAANQPAPERGERCTCARILTPRSGATWTLDRSHTAYAVGYDLASFGLGPQKGRPDSVPIPPLARPDANDLQSSYYAR
jgi:hypothetical protein